MRCVLCYHIRRIVIHRFQLAVLVPEYVIHNSQVSELEDPKLRPGLIFLHNGVIRLCQPKSPIKPYYSNTLIIIVPSEKLSRDYTSAPLCTTNSI